MRTNFSHFLKPAMNPQENPVLSTDLVQYTNPFNPSYVFVPLAVLSVSVLAAYYFGLMRDQQRTPKPIVKPSEPVLTTTASLFFSINSSNSLPQSSTTNSMSGSAASPLLKSPENLKTFFEEMKKISPPECLSIQEAPSLYPEILCPKDTVITKGTTDSEDLPAIKHWHCNLVSFDEASIFAGQPPLNSETFWNTIFDQKIKCVIELLTKDEMKEMKKKTANTSYYPSEKIFHCGQMEISPKNFEIYHKHHLHTYQIVKANGSTKELKRLQWDDWKSRDFLPTPKRFEELTSLCEILKKYQRHVIVICPTGTDKTAVLIAAYYLKEQIDNGNTNNKKDIDRDLRHVITKLKLQRGIKCIGTKEELILLQKYANHLLKTRRTS